MYDTQQIDWTKMKGTGGYYDYIVVADTPAGRVGTKSLGSGKVRVRVEPTQAGQQVCAEACEGFGSAPEPNNVRYSVIVFDSQASDIVGDVAQALFKATNGEGRINPSSQYSGAATQGRAKATGQYVPAQAQVQTPAQTPAQTPVSAPAAPVAQPTSGMNPEAKSEALDIVEEIHDTATDHDDGHLASLAWKLAKLLRKA